MRILSFLVKAVLIIAILLGIGFLTMREVLLIVGENQVKTSLSKLKYISKNSTDYARICRQKGVEPGQPTIAAYQLRFLSDTEYVTEVICNQFQNDPIQVEQQTLPMSVKKLPLSSGIIWGDDLSGIGIEVWGRRRAIIVENQVVLYEPVNEKTNYGISPTASCASFGFSCCVNDISQGVGAQYTGVTDCPQTCYSACQPRPVVLAFTTDPYIDPQTKTTTVSQGQEVRFAYVVDDQGITTSQITLDFGDGSQAQSTQLSDELSHTYTCQQASCTYTAHLTVRSAEGLEAAETQVNQIQIQVKR